LILVACIESPFDPRYSLSSMRRGGRKSSDQVRLGVTPEINAVCSVFIAAVTLVVIAESLVAKREAVGRERAAQMAARA
jgi:hypothetical protein